MPEKKHAAVMIIHEMSADERIKELRMQREKALSIEAGELSAAEARGRAEGREEGKADERKALIEKMHKKGYTDEQIADLLS